MSNRALKRTEMFMTPLMHDKNTIYAMSYQKFSIKDVIQ